MALSPHDGGVLRVQCSICSVEISCKFHSKFQVLKHNNFPPDQALLRRQPVTAETFTARLRRFEDGTTIIGSIVFNSGILGSRRPIGRVQAFES